MASTTIQEIHGALARKRAERLDDFVARARAADGGQEAAAEVIDGPRSLVFRQPAGRLPSELAESYALMTGEWE